MFLYNAIVGFVGAIIRVLLSLGYGTLLLFRLDQNIMMEGFQFADEGELVNRELVRTSHAVSIVRNGVCILLINDDIFVV